MSETNVKIKLAKKLVLQNLNYSFHDSTLLLEAITHKSISKKNYERLEFLGDAVLQLVVTKFLFNKYPDHKEGLLSREKQYIVSKKILSKISLELDFLSILHSNNLKVSSSHSLRETLSADIMESILGAIFLDSNYSTCEKIILKIFSMYLDNNKEIGKKDPKTLLQEYMQSIGEPLPTYSTSKMNGPMHDPDFKISCKLAIYESSEFVISKTVQSGQQSVSQIFLDKLANEKKI
tara:strand:+ start:772 stop:1476 length:705 start_codon:yes stop_codon:yes gene_type:complete